MKKKKNRRNKKTEEIYKRKKTKNEDISEELTQEWRIDTETD